MIRTYTCSGHKYHQIFSLHTGNEAVFLHERPSFMEGWSPKLDRSFLTLPWAQPAPCTWEGSAPHRRGHQIFGSDILTSHLQFAKGMVTCEVLGGEEPLPQGGTHTPLAHPGYPLAPPVSRITSSSHHQSNTSPACAPCLHDSDSFTPLHFNYLSLVWDNINSAVISSGLTVGFWGKNSITYTTFLFCHLDGTPKTSILLDFMHGLATTMHTSPLCCITAQRLGCTVKEEDEASQHLISTTLPASDPVNCSIDLSSFEDFTNSDLKFHFLFLTGMIEENKK